MVDLKFQKKQFVNHIAKFTDYGNIKIVDFKRSDSNEYRIRFLFEEDYCRLHISGDKVRRRLPLPELQEGIFRNGNREILLSLRTEI